MEGRATVEKGKILQVEEGLTANQWKAGIREKLRRIPRRNLVEEVEEEEEERDKLRIEEPQTGACGSGW
jgi:hypothetical protein